MKRSPPVLPRSFLDIGDADMAGNMTYSKYTIVMQWLNASLFYVLNNYFRPLHTRISPTHSIDLILILATSVRSGLIFGPVTDSPTRYVTG